MIEDRQARERALDPTTSFIVQAPAGSGKTGLLIQRYLALLERVAAPEAVVAITFTKKAAGEMRSRVVESLRQASRGDPPSSAHDRRTFDLARAALARDAAAGWRLVENPARIRIQTIDSLCASLTRQMPWLSGFGAPAGITEKAGELYLEAARNTLAAVAQEEREAREGPLSILLLHLENDFSGAARLIKEMLETRDQWLRHIGAGPDLGQVRGALEDALHRRVVRELTALRDSFSPDGRRALLLLLDRESLPSATPEAWEEWVELADLLLTQKGDLRKKAPPNVSTESWSRATQRLAREPVAVGRMKEVRRLPATRFDDAQWKVLEALVAVLPLAVAHLQAVFRERGRTDFAELSIRASAALGRLESPTDLGLALGQRIEHLLVDEFQDTSYTQYDLLAKLTAGWEPGDGRTLFLVGDPMQSIYRFREADVGLFLKARREGIGSILPEPLSLTMNFRSDPAIVNWVNQTFQSILPDVEDPDRGAVPFSASIASRASSRSSKPPEIHAFVGEAQADEADRIAELIDRAGQGTTAVLVRARTHLTALVRLLRARRIPYQAIEIDGLDRRPAVQDAMSLTFALLHLGDRISWLAILRAPWCGLTLEDLDRLAGADRSATLWDLLRRNLSKLTGSGRQHAERCLPILEAALDERGRAPLRSVVERTWLRLGGPACLDPESSLEDVEAYFDLLESLEEAGDLPSFGALRRQIDELFATPDPAAGERLQIMTIHKAKGLEFDTVILPGLGQKGRGDETKLLLFLEEQGDLMIAPVGASADRGDGDRRDRIYDYLAHVEGEKERQEAGRLLYVAATRARNELHLLGCARANDREGASATAGSFLKLLWPTTGHLFIAESHRLRGLPTPPASAQTPEPRQIRRLTLDWRLPAPPPPAVWTRTASEPVGEPDVPYEWVGDASRHAGTVLHDFYRRIAAEGLERWNPARVSASSQSILTMLANLGVPALEAPETARRVERALLSTLSSERGRWILAPHTGALTEFEISGVLDGRVHQVKIDRTFVDETGVRWIVDFKTSAHEGGGIENFLESERRRHAPQLERYAKLMAQRDERPIRLAIYFPLLNEWVEWGAPTIKRRQASLFD